MTAPASPTADGSAPTVSGRLTSFLLDWRDRGLPREVLREAKRLLLNQLKASIGAVDDPGVRILHDWATRAGSTTPAAHVLWLGTETAPAQAAVVNGALFEVLDFNDTYIPTYLHATSAVLPAVLAVAEEGAHSAGREIEFGVVVTRLSPHGPGQGLVR